jgi:L-alanine-DL-glutamate epimerase-like enolase superfamily enzyme
MTTICSGTARSYTIPTDVPEADGTYTWTRTTMVVVTLQTQGQTGIGYTYTHSSAVLVARDLIEKQCVGADALDINTIFAAMRIAQRNYGRQGIAATALSAIDIALWDLKSKILNQPLGTLLGATRPAAPVYGSGGFTTYTDEQLQRQLCEWVEQGVPRVKMKIGADPKQDPHRVAVARKAIGDEVNLFVDANGAFSPKQALFFGEKFFHEQHVTWFEEPVSSDDLAGLRLLRERVPADMQIAAGEYGWDSMYLRHMMECGAVDVIQADSTRCGGVTGFMDTAAIADACPLPLSAHCGPTIHMHLACAARPLIHIEYFHDHVRIERMLFDGFCPASSDGCMHPDWSRAGLGVELKQQDAERFLDDV